MAMTRPQSDAMWEDITSKLVGGDFDNQRREDLSLLPGMPFDILFEIFRRLSPEDLISISHTNRLFRQTLLSSSATTVWKTVREVYDAPAPLRHLPEPQWSALLFLTSCMTCGPKGVAKLDWYLQRRVCLHCKEYHLVQGSEFRSKFPHYEPEVLNYVPFTRISRRSRDQSTNSKYYWDDDIRSIAEEWKNFERTTHSGQLDSKEKFDNWKKQHVEHLKYIAKMAVTYEAWCQRMVSIKAAEAAEDRQKRLAAVRAKFLELGYEAVDIDGSLSVHTEGICTGTPHVTNAVWSRLRPKLEPRVIMHQVQRWSHQMPKALYPSPGLELLFLILLALAASASALVVSVIHGLAWFLMSLCSLVGILVAFLIIRCSLFI